MDFLGKCMYIRRYNTNISPGNIVSSAEKKQLPACINHKKGFYGFIHVRWFGLIWSKNNTTVNCGMQISYLQQLKNVLVYFRQMLSKKCVVKLVLLRLTQLLQNNA